MEQKVVPQQNTVRLEQTNYASPGNFTPALLETFRRSGHGTNITHQQEEEQKDYTKFKVFLNHVESIKKQVIIETEVEDSNFKKKKMVRLLANIQDYNLDRCVDLIVAKWFLILPFFTRQR